MPEEHGSSTLCLTAWVLDEGCHVPHISDLGPANVTLQAALLGFAHNTPDRSLTPFYTARCSVGDQARGLQGLLARKTSVPAFRKADDLGGSSDAHPMPVTVSMASAVQHQRPCLTCSKAFLGPWLT